MAKPRRDPPRWFVPALFAGMFSAAMALLALGALFEDATHEPIRIGGSAYVVPPDHVSSLTRDPHVFIRIAPPGRPFQIVHDARAAGRRDRTGVPHIFSINDHGEHDVWYSRDGAALVLCRRASSPAGGCGTWINHGGAVWAILFPESRRREADAYAREARILLRGYDTRASRLLP